jgi:hypothetical protein
MIRRPRPYRDPGTAAVDDAVGRWLERKRQQAELDRAKANLEHARVWMEQQEAVRRFNALAAWISGGEEQ